MAAVRADDLHLGSKQTYAPQQDASTCEAPPAGFAQVFGFHAASQDYARESIVFTASGASTALSFFAFDDQSYVELDDVRVTTAPVPEPGTAPLMLAGLMLATASVALRRGRA